MAAIRVGCESLSNDLLFMRVLRVSNNHSSDETSSAITNKENQVFESIEDLKSTTEFMLCAINRVQDHAKLGMHAIDAIHELME